jgi:hypothetical protein
MEDSKDKLEKAEIILKEILKSINVNKLIEFEENDFISTYYPGMLLLKVWLLEFINEEEVIPIEKEITHGFYLFERKKINDKLDELYISIRDHFFENYDKIGTVKNIDDNDIKLYKIYVSHKKMYKKRY